MCCINAMLLVLIHQINTLTLRAFTVILYFVMYVSWKQACSERLDSFFHPSHFSRFDFTMYSITESISLRRRAFNRAVGGYWHRKYQMIPYLRFSSWLKREDNNSTEGLASGCLAVLETRRIWERQWLQIWPSIRPCMHIKGCIV